MRVLVLAVIVATGVAAAGAEIAPGDRRSGYEKGRRDGEVDGARPMRRRREWLCSTDPLEQQESADEGGGP
jgi:hypothetical protein